MVETCMGWGNHVWQRPTLLMLSLSLSAESTVSGMHNVPPSPGTAVGNLALYRRTWSLEAGKAGRRGWHAIMGT